VYKSLKEELVELIGSKTYKTMVQLLEEKNSVPLPHPQVRRKTKKK
jgi:hypothetical protein